MALIPKVPSESPADFSSGARELLPGLLPGLFLGLLPGGLALGADRMGLGPVPGLVFAGLLAPLVGARLGGVGALAAGRMALAALGVWICWSFVPRTDALGVLCAWSGLMLLGSGLGSLLRGRWSLDSSVLGAALFLLAAFLTVLPGGAGRVDGGAFEPEITAWLLDLSPASLMVESAGIDWLRHPAVYGPAGGDAIGPDLRGPWGPLAGGVLALLGCVLTFLGWRWRRAPEHHVIP